MLLVVTGICNPSSCILWICNPVTHPDVKRISFSRIKNPDNTYSWDCKSQRQFAPFITIIEGISERTSENIETFHFKYKNLTLETDAPEVERMITIVQVASDNLKNYNDGYTSSLHILETTNEIMKTTLAELDEKNRQINIDFERAMEKIKVGYK